MVNRFNFMFACVFLVLKFLTDMNCTVWRLNWTDTLCIIIQIVSEGLFIDIFYTWYRNKVTVLKFSLTENLMPRDD